MILDWLYEFLRQRRDKKRHEVIQLRWEKAKLEKLIAEKKAEKERK